MHPHQKKIESVIAALKKVHDLVEAEFDNDEMVMLKTRVQKRLESEGNFLTSIINGQPFVENPTQEAEPITKLFGKDLKDYQRPGKIPMAGALIHGSTIAPEVDEKKLSPEEEELLKEVDELWPNFLTLDPAEIIDKHDDLVIRAIATKAGLPVTEKSPKKIDTKFIAHIKKTIETMNALASAGTATEVEE